MTARLRTGYSFRSAVGKLPSVIERIKEIGLTHAPITDTSSTFGYAKWRKIAKAAGLRPVFGVELAVTNSIHEKKPSIDYWTFIAKDSLVPINELVALATKQFRYQPLLTREQALERTDVFTIMGYRADFPAIKARDDLFFGLGPSMTKGQVKRAIEAGHMPIAVSDNRYTMEGQQGFYETVCGRNASTQSYPQWIMSDGEWIKDCYDRFGYEIEKICGDALNNRLFTVFNNSTADLVQAEMVHPDRAKSLEAMCREEAAQLGCDLTRPEYAARLKRELDLITEKGYEDYFYLVADICQWARSQMIVGPGRGSSAGSLVCYLLGITTVDPIPHGCLFERFIDINRSDMPDIDLDFPDHRRQEVLEYIAKKYGREKVARLGTVMMYQAKSALRESAAAMDIAPWLLDPVKEVLIERADGDERAFNTIEDTLKETVPGNKFLEKYPEIMIATEMEGHPRHAGQHAAGIVITEQPIRQYIAIDQRTGATMCDKRDAEELNLLKIDALGLAQLSIFEKALELAKLPRDHLFSLGLDDPAAFDVLNRGKFTGIAQFNGQALQSIAKQIEIKEFRDLAAISALARPGPLGGGATEQWVKVRRGVTQPSYPHKLLEPHLKSTLGVVIYQEQVMTISREVAGMSWEDVTGLRKAMAKTQGQEVFNKYKEKFVSGCVEKKIPKDLAETLFDDLSSFGSYAFNLSHAVAYAMISYYCCWLKAYYPLEFAAATLTYTDSPETQIKLLREMAAEGVEYLPADIDLSSTTWTVKKGGNWNHLVGPLNNVVGVGPKMMSTIMSCRARGEPLPERARKLLENPKTKIDSLFPIAAAFKRLMPDPKAMKIFSEPKRIIDVQTNGSEYEVLVLACVEQINPRDENDEKSLAKRNGQKMSGSTAFLNLWLADDTDSVFAKIDRSIFETYGKPIVERGRAGKALYAIKGNVPRGFRMVSVKAVRYIGDLEQ